MAQDAKTVARRWFEEVWNERRDAAVDELMDAKSVGHVEGGVVYGPEGFRRMRQMFLAALPDVRIILEDVIAEGNQAVVRWRAVGTHGGEGFGFAATGRPVDVRGMTWVVVRDGKLVEGFDTWNLHGLMASLKAPAEAKAEALF
jgi:predicted ester cyclase